MSVSLFVFSILLAAIGIIILLIVKSDSREIKSQRIIWSVSSLVIAVILFFLSVLTIIPAGSVGVGTTFGAVSKNVFYPGLRMKLPITEIILFPTRMVAHNQSGPNDMLKVQSKDNLNLDIDCTLQYSVNDKTVVDLYMKYAQSDYAIEENIIIPSVRSYVRNVVSKYTMEELLSSKREEAANTCETTLRENMASFGLLVYKFLIRGVTPPENVNQAIQAKITAQQEAEAMQYKRQKAQQEADIKVIEAEGLRKAQDIVNKTLTPLYVQHEAIQAYSKLAGAPNTTFVILPTSPNAAGMPIILGGVK